MIHCNWKRKSAGGEISSKHWKGVTFKFSIRKGFANISHAASYYKIIFEIYEEHLAAISFKK